MTKVLDEYWPRVIVYPGATGKVFAIVGEKIWLKLDKRLPVLDTVCNLVPVPTNKPRVLSTV